MDNRRQRVITVVGTRPEIIKCSPIIPLLDELADQTLVHTGQHYDDNMDSRFFRELELRQPDHNLAVGSGSPVGQLSRMMQGLEPIITSIDPDWVIVQGDTNSTLAGGLAAAKLNIPLAHIEAGCRSFNRAMPEETNRITVDHLATLCLAPDQLAMQHLAAEGIVSPCAQLVGSTGIDACLRMRALLRDDVAKVPGEQPQEDFLLATIHRAENTQPERLRELVGALGDLGRTYPVIFPVHPRTAAVLHGMSLPATVQFIDPVSYREMIELLSSCRALLTDSGGLQEEAAVLGTPTFILRRETEWSELVDAGHHRLAGVERAAIVDLVQSILADEAQVRIMREPIGVERAGAARRIIGQLLDQDMEMEQTWKSRAIA